MLLISHFAAVILLRTSSGDFCSWKGQEWSVFICQNRDFNRLLVFVHLHVRLVHVNVVASNRRFYMVTECLLKLMKSRSLVGFRFPAVGHQSTDHVGCHLRFLHSVTDNQFANQLSEIESRIRHFAKGEQFPHDDTKRPHVRLTRKDHLRKRLGCHPFDIWHVIWWTVGTLRFLFLVSFNGISSI